MAGFQMVRGNGERGAVHYNRKALIPPARSKRPWISMSDVVVHEQVLVVWESYGGEIVSKISSELLTMTVGHWY